MENRKHPEGQNPEDLESSASVDQLPSHAMIDVNREDVRSGIENVAGSEMAEAQGVVDAQDTVRKALPAPENISLPEGSKSIESDSPAKEHIEQTGNTSTLTAEEEVLKAGQFGLAGAAAGAGLGAAGAVTTGLSSGGTAAEIAVLGGATAASTGASFAIGALALYGGGMLHNALWSKDSAQRPGILGTAARGVIAPISVPLGVMYKTTKKAVHSEKK